MNRPHTSAGSDVGAVGGGDVVGAAAEAPSSLEAFSSE